MRIVTTCCGDFHLFVCSLCRIHCVTWFRTLWLLSLRWFKMRHTVWWICRKTSSGEKTLSTAVSSKPWNIETHCLNAFVWYDNIKLAWQVLRMVKEEGGGGDFEAGLRTRKSCQEGDRWTKGSSFLSFLGRPWWSRACDLPSSHSLGASVSHYKFMDVSWNAKFREQIARCTIHYFSNFKVSKSSWICKPNFLPFVGIDGDVTVYE